MSAWGGLTVVMETWGTQDTGSGDDTCVQTGAPVLQGSSLTKVVRAS